MLTKCKGLHAHRIDAVWVALIGTSWQRIAHPGYRTTLRAKVTEGLHIAGLRQNAVAESFQSGRHIRDQGAALSWTPFHTVKVCSNDYGAEWGWRAKPGGVIAILKTADCDPAVGRWKHSVASPYIAGTAWEDCRTLVRQIDGLHVIGQYNATRSRWPHLRHRADPQST